MKAYAKVKRVNIDGMTVNYYRFKIEFKDHTGKPKEFIRWASTAENAILTLCKQYGWTLALPISPVYGEDYCKAKVRIWVQNRYLKNKHDAGGRNTYPVVEAWQTDCK